MTPPNWWQHELQPVIVLSLILVEVILLNGINTIGTLNPHGQLGQSMLSPRFDKAPSSKTATII
jgi:hypothetical protein